MTENPPHIPVMVKEVVSLLLTDPSGIYLDGTVGYGGHASELLSRLTGGGFLIGLDRDASALEFTEKFLSEKYCRERFSLYQLNYKDFPKVLHERRDHLLSGVLLDLGISSINIDDADRGFSFQKEGPLDMRFDRSTGISAAEYLKQISATELARVLRDYGEERFHKKIATAIVEKAGKGEMNTTFDLKNAIISVIFGKSQLKSVARVFQAIRIALNDELKALQVVLESILSHLATGGRIAVITFHSLEDRIVKQFFKTNTLTCICPPELPKCVCNVVPRLKIITRKPILPTQDEIKLNSRSRSAKLRVAERI
ncbi:MAG: 16S rRNA (cytosine(1402)-N(4))-methyltransferase RsmH [FCB group bacterium]|nr:16S rRNA (cytosine(1402)-N(4))-methyltransferase RsmH [FCB group bacterium]